MDYLNLHTSALDSPAFVGANPVERATWLCLLRYCIGQENGGRILECSTWGDSKWQQMCRVKLREVRTATELWYWEEFNLVVNFYPKKQEQNVKANRKTGHKGGRPKKLQNNPPVIKTITPRVNVREEEGKRKSKGIKERKGKEEEVRATPTPPDSQTAPVGILPDPSTASWESRNQTQAAAMREVFAKPTSRVIDVLRFFVVVMDLRGTPLEPEWRRETKGQTASEVAEVFFQAPPKSINLPSHYREANRLVAPGKIA